MENRSFRAMCRNSPIISPIRPRQAVRAVRAVPGTGLKVPLWISGSSLFGAQVAAAFGLPYAFASHFAPAQMMAAIELYRREFRASRNLAKPYVRLRPGTPVRWSQPIVTSRQTFVLLRAHGRRRENDAAAWLRE
jgi:hypothetical protein